MNPFLYDTARRSRGGAAHPRACRDAVNARASDHAAEALDARSDGAAVRRPGRPRPHRLSHLLVTAGIAALAWAGTAGAVDLNTATLDQLQSVRGIGPKTARIILEERTRAGHYRSFTDLSDRVRGIGPRRARSLQAAGLTLDGGGRLSGQGQPARPTADQVGSIRRAGPAKSSPTGRR